MNRITFLALASASALALAACSDGSDNMAPAEQTAAAETSAADTAAAEEAPAVLNANDATIEQLGAVDGVSAELAQAIVDGRPYASVTDLAAVLGEEGSALLSSVFVPVNLNTASEEELRLIPGMNDKMVHEFEEYRPYATMDDFDREIGKYVDEEEVARFRQYVTL
ncbi:ComEA family DNA-binding protein [Paraurantiacibacter namhicola]|uniref:Photosystem II 12 kDa extrinsic protein n=1 Tax=Paraurantiacibacter namhicola TaxID=645517 RepID=A0A1C7D4V9_9SPHN|nr:helix-hairpin-helix domain-containing protein [Paraurantiacibacter namhicola]ANU06508.1 Photosystem II 12 kDa extrinsic protein [Paraurantiacibacter namhicola]